MIAKQRRRREVLEGVLDDLQDLHGTGDVEAAHGLADDLLVRVIEELARGPEEQELARRICRAYDDVEKWYA